MLYIVRIGGIAGRKRGSHVRDANIRWVGADYRRFKASTPNQQKDTGRAILYILLHVYTLGKSGYWLVVLYK